MQKRTRNGSLAAPPRCFVTLAAACSGPLSPAALPDHSGQQHTSNSLLGHERGADGALQRPSAHLLPSLPYTIGLRALLTTARLSADSAVYGQALDHKSITKLAAGTCATVPLQTATCHWAIGVARGTRVAVPALIPHLHVRNCTGLWGHRVNLDRARRRTRTIPCHSYSYIKS